MRYHLIGDQGISMQGIKIILQKQGHIVTGSDLKTGGHNPKNITSDINFVIRNSAITPGSEGWIEVLEAEKLKIPVIKRSAFLGELTSDKFLIAVSGMHGKTTVTALIGLILIKAGLDPTVLVGEKVLEFGNKVVRIGQLKYFVAEVCEYDRSFHDFHPNIAVITNLDVEHLDTYPGGMPEIKEAFNEFLKNIKKKGVVVACAEDKNLSEVVKKARSDIKKVYYGRSSEKYSELKFPLKLIGDHNQTNALAALAVADSLGIPDDVVAKVFASFGGAKRRLEKKGRYRGMIIYDDYGHHPNEISAAINALRDKYPNRKIRVIFWPHQYKRIMPLKDEFTKSLSLADEVILKPIYLVPGRDKKLKISSEDLVTSLDHNKTSARIFSSDQEIIKYLKKTADDSSLVLTIGIPPIYKVADVLVSGEK